MKEKRVNSDISFLPQEIIRNILKRLPAKTLIRFQCVCREWRNLFKTKSFIADHLNHSNHQNPCLLFHPFDRDDPSNLYCLDSEMQVWEFQNPTLLDYLNQGRIVGSSNGLLCVQINNPDESPHLFFVWNPSIREVRLVPEINFHQDNDDYFISFGFTPIINDYKLVIACVSDYYAELSAVKVYSLSSGSWREVKLRLNCTACISYRSVTVNGVMFWLGLKLLGENTEYDDEALIVSFDLANEKFTLIALPKLHFWTTITVYEEKLAIVSLRNSEPSVIDLWVMEEGVRASGRDGVGLRNILAALIRAGYIHRLFGEVKLCVGLSWRMNQQLFSSILLLEESRSMLLANVTVIMIFSIMLRVLSGWRNEIIHKFSVGFGLIHDVECKGDNDLAKVFLSLQPHSS